MAHEAEVRYELGRLRSRLPDVTGALAASVDGLVLAEDAPGLEPETFAALTAAALGIALRLAAAAGQHAFRELVVRSDQGYVATYAAGEVCVLALVAGPRTNIGRLHLEARRSGAYLAHLLDGVAPAAADPRTFRPPPGHPH